MSVPDLEQRLHMSREWERTNKPKVSATGPLDPASPKADMDKVRLKKKGATARRWLRQSERVARLGLL